jgi:prolyl-tRNA synthetase
MGTSHMISQSFAKAFDMKFQDSNGSLAYPYLTSWGVTTRLVGALVMAHGDQKGLIIPPKIAPIHVVIIPIMKKNKDNTEVLDAAYAIKKQLGDTYDVIVDTDEHKTPGAKFYEWELKGIPIRIELGPRDLKNNQAVVVNRLDGIKKALPLDTLSVEIPIILDTMQKSLFDRAQKRMKQKWYKAIKLADFSGQLYEKPGFYQVGWCQNIACEDELKKYQLSTRCLLEEKTNTVCFHCDQESKGDVLVAKSY